MQHRMAQCGKKSGEKLLDSWHISTQQPCSAADYQVSTQPVRGGLHDSTTKVCVDLQTITSYTAFILSTAKQSPDISNQNPFSFFYNANFKAGLKQGRIKIFMMAS